eukprot:664135-Amphidinium_carterae.1
MTLGRQSSIALCRPIASVQGAVALLGASTLSSTSTFCRLTLAVAAAALDLRQAGQNDGAGAFTPAGNLAFICKLYVIIWCANSGIEPFSGMVGHWSE